MVSNIMFCGPSWLHVADALPKPLPFQFAERRLAIFKSPNGFSALEDACPHRQAALSGGRVDNGCIECPYHGWQFDHGGALARVPSRPGGEAHRRISARKFDIVEICEFLFFSAALEFYPEVAPGSRLASTRPTPSFESCQYSLNENLQGQAVNAESAKRFFGLEPKQRWKSATGSFVWKAHFTRVVANSIDVAHLPFVHGKQFGDSDRTEVPPSRIVSFDGGAGSSVDLRVPDNFIQGVSRMVLGKSDHRVIGTVSFFLPNVTRLDLDLGGNKRLVLIASHVPSGAGTTTTYWAACRNFLTQPLFDQAFKMAILNVFLADQRVVESQQGPMSLSDGSARDSVPSDALELEYRRQLRQLIETS